MIAPASNKASSGARARGVGEPIPAGSGQVGPAEALLFDPGRHNEALALLSADGLRQRELETAFMFADRRCRRRTPSARAFLLRATVIRAPLEGGRSSTADVQPRFGGVQPPLEGVDPTECGAPVGQSHNRDAETRMLIERGLFGRVPPRAVTTIAPRSPHPKSKNSVSSDISNLTFPLRAYVRSTARESSRALSGDCEAPPLSKRRFARERERASPRRRSPVTPLRGPVLRP